MNDYMDVKEYLEICKNTNNKPYIFILLLFLIGAIGLGCFKVEMYYEIQGYVLEDLLVLNVHVEDLEKISNNQYIYINKKKYKYVIYDYAEEVMTYQDQYYKTVRLQIPLDEKLNADYNILKVKFELKNEVFFNIIINKVKGEL